MANLNLRNVPDDLYHRVRLAAANGGARIPKGALERFMIRALRRAVEDPQPGAGLPKLKMCASCFQANQGVFQRPKVASVPLSGYDTAEQVLVDTQKPAPVELFNHLLDEDQPGGAAAGMLDAAPSYETFPQLLGEVDGGPIATITADLAALGWVEVQPDLWVGSDEILGSPEDWPGYSVLSAAKNPWHKTMVGYLTKSAPEGPERLFARRGNHLALNLIDVRQLGPGGAHYVPDEVIEAAMAFLDERLAAGVPVLLHCNHGISRAPTLAYLYMLRTGQLAGQDPGAAFAQKYPRWQPSAGMTRYLEEKKGK